ncbi:unnamed protein product [Closterium sp. NIES-54]
MTTTDASLSITVDSGVSRCFFRDHTTVTPLVDPVPVAMADPTSGPAVAHGSTTLSCPAVPSGVLTGLYIPSFSRNLVDVGYLQDHGITVTFPAHGRTAICMDASTRAVLATFTRQPHSGDSPTSLWTGSPSVASKFHVWGCLALVRNTSADKLSARAIPCVLLGFPVDSPDFSFYHPPLHRFLDSHDVRFDKSVSYYTRYPCRGLPVSPPPLFLAPSPLPLDPAPPVPLPPPLSCPVTVDSGGVGAGGAATRGTRSGGACSRGAGAGGAGTGGASSGGAGAGGAGNGGASSGGVGAGGAGTGGASPGSARAGGASTEEAVVGAGEVGATAVGLVGAAATTTAVAPDAAAAAAAVAAAAAFAAAVPSSEWPLGPWSSFLSSCPLTVSYRVRSYISSSEPGSSCFLSSSVTVASSCSPAQMDNSLSPRARPSSPFDHLCTVLFCSSPRRAQPVSVLRPPPALSLTVSSHPITDYYRSTRPIVSRVLASLVTDPRASPSSVSSLTAVVANFAANRCLEFATRVVVSLPASPLSARGEFSLGCDVLEDTQFELEFLAAASPSLSAMLLSPEGVPDALDIPTPRTYHAAVSADRAALAELKSELQKRHTCTKLGELCRYLGLQITRDSVARTITLSRSHMVRQVLQQFGLQYSTTQPTPLAVDHRLTGPFPDKPFEPSGPYVELVGCLMYLMTCTQPDLAFPLSLLARFVATGRHQPVYWTAAVRVAKYLATISGMGLVLGGTELVVLTGHCDSSYADDAGTQHSTQEAEIYAGAMAAQELCWLTFLLTDLGERPRSAPTLFADNKAMILLCREPRVESRVKHIDMRYFLLRELQRRGQARLDFVALEANSADIFTKALMPSDHHRFCVQLGLVEAGPRLL